MKTLRLVRGEDHWQVNYDETQRTVTVQGPAPDAARIHRWLTTNKRVVDATTGNLLTVVPVEGWDYMRQAVDTDLYGDLRWRRSSSRRAPDSRRTTRPWATRPTASAAGLSNGARALPGDETERGDDDEQ